MDLIKHVFAGSLGTASGLICVVLGDTLSHWLRPILKSEEIAEGDSYTVEQLQQFVDTAPMASQLTLVLGWVLAVGFAAWVGRRLAPQRLVRTGLVAAIILLFGVVANLFALQHPLWMNIVGPILAILAVPVGLVLAAPRSYFVEATEVIDAPLGQVFQTISTVEGFQSAVPQITNVEFLSEQQSGVGTRFRETRIINGKEAKATLEITELEPLKSVRMVSIEGGVVWDTVFEVETAKTQTEVKMVMEARPQNPIGHLMTPLILGMIHRAVAADLQSIKRWCEAENTKTAEN